MKNPKIQVDIQDNILLEKHGFCVNGAGYVVACIGGEVKTLHSLILGKRKGLEIDHINGDKLDNRRENLRHVSHQKNIWNMMAPKNSKTGIKGVTFDGRINKWIARISPNRQSKHLGSFSTIEEATFARKNAELIYAQ